MAVDFKFEAGSFDYTSQMRRAYEEYGYFFVRGLLTPGELDKLKTTVEGSDAFLKHAYGIPDGEGSEIKMLLYSHPGTDVTGMIARSEKVAGMCEKILGGEVYHYHTKVILKEAQTGGQFIWHQDYGYWYKNGCLFPDLITVYIAYDACNKENGCLQVLRGSHKCGRIDHKMTAGQQGADNERVTEIAKVCPLDYVELQPGDAIYFHPNLLHMAPPNRGVERRWAFLCCYNKASNDPVYKHHCPNYTKLHKVPDSAIMECENLTNMEGKDFMDPRNDKTVKFAGSENK